MKVNMIKQSTLNNLWHGILKQAYEKVPEDNGIDLRKPFPPVSPAAVQPGAMQMKPAIKMDKIPGWVSGGTPGTIIPNTVKQLASPGYQPTVKK